MRLSELNDSSMIIQRVLLWLFTEAIIDSLWRVPPTANVTDDLFRFQINRRLGAKPQTVL